MVLDKFRLKMERAAFLVDIKNGACTIADASRALAHDYRIDCATEKARTRKIGDAIGPFALDEARSRIYVITAGDVAVISGSGFDVEGEKLNLSAPEDIYAHSIAVSGKTGFVYASGVTSKKEGGDYPRALAVVDPESRKPDTLAWNVDITRMVPDPRNTYVYCTDQKNSQLLVVQDMKGTYTREGKGSE